MAADELKEHRKSFEEAQEALRVALFEAVRAHSVNKLRLEDVIKKYLEKEQAYLAKIHDRLLKLSGPMK